MAFDFLGTFTKRELESLRSSLQSELAKVDAQTNHMVLESSRLQKLLQSQLAVNENNGIKFKTFQQTFLRKLQSPYDDADTAKIVLQTKEPYFRNIKYKEQFEARVRKIIDKIEQIQEQIHLLRISKTELRANMEKLNSMFDVYHPYLTVDEEVSNVV